MLHNTDNTGSISKVKTGIPGFDDITRGGLPKGRPSLLIGAAGTGKTTLGMQFLYNGATDHNENGVFFSFEEKRTDLISNMYNFGWDLQATLENKGIIIDEITLDTGEVVEAGTYDLEGLFVRMESQIKKAGAKRIVIDSMEGLFQFIPSQRILRNELRRLFQWTKEKGLTAIITAEAGNQQLTRYGIEEYISDSVILLETRLIDQMPSRRLRILKYRGSAHGENEYPFLIDSNGIYIFPITSLSLDFKVSNERVKTGVNRLDNMLGGMGFYKGSSVLIAGTSGTGKTTLANTILKAACDRGEKSFYFSYEESFDQIMRNMKSVGMDLKPYISKGLLKYQSTRPTTFSLEKHLINTFRLLEEFNPEFVVVDPVSNLGFISEQSQVRNMLTQLIDFMKSRNMTSVFTELYNDSGTIVTTSSKISSLMDTWILLQDKEIQGERNRTLSILKSRGIKHSNQIREFSFSNKGIELTDVFVGAEGVLTGTARVIQEAKHEIEKTSRMEGIKRLKKELLQREKEFNAEIEKLKSKYLLAREDLEIQIRNAELEEKVLEKNRSIMREKRGKD